MTNPGMSIPADQFQMLVGKAIIDAMSTDAKNTVLATAIEYLIAPQKNKDRWGTTTTSPSPLQYSFEAAVRKLADEVAAELVQQLRPQVVESFGELLGGIEIASYDQELQVKLLQVITKHTQEKYNERFK